MLLLIVIALLAVLFGFGGLVLKAAWWMFVIAGALTASDRLRSVLERLRRGRLSADRP
jgi:hypothetical protein